MIKETLRLHPPGSLLLPRECIETCEINGYTIPAGTQVLVNAWAIGRDQKYWLKGFHFEFIPFGAGKRICQGMLLAESNIELPLAQLLYYFDWQFPYGTNHENFDMTEAFGTTVKRKSDLFLIPIPYNI